MYEGFLSHLERRVFPGGCFFASAAAELDTRPGGVKDEIACVQQHSVDQLQQLIREAQNAGSLASGEDPAQLAFELEAYLLMGNTAFVLNNEPTPPTGARGDRKPARSHGLLRLARPLERAHVPLQERLHAQIEREERLRDRVGNDATRA